MIKRLVVWALLLAILSMLCACGAPAYGAELIPELEALAPKAAAMYEVIYGDALPHGEAGSDGYCEVSADAPYRSISELKLAMTEVFTEEYIRLLSNTAFSGISVDEGSIGAKFVEREGVLYVNPSVTEGFAKPRSFDFSKASVLKANRYMARISLAHDDGSIEVTIRLIDGRWLLDSPMF